AGSFVGTRVRQRGQSAAAARPFQREESRASPRRRSTNLPSPEQRRDRGRRKRPQACQTSSSQCATTRAKTQKASDAYPRPAGNYIAAEVYDSETVGLRIPRLGTILGFVICLSGGSVAATDPKVADAIEKRDRTALQALLKQHTDVNIPQADGATALHWAAHWNDVDVVNLLIQAGANVNAPNAYGVTPLSLACAEGSTAVAERLLDVGA